MRLRTALLLVAIIGLISGVFSCASPEQQTKAEQDQIVVECAEFGLWRLMASDTEREFYELLRESDFWSVAELEDLDFRLLLGLEAEGIVLGADEDPFGEHDDYIAFKADFYRGMLGWGDLPPAEIMNTVETSKID